MHRSSPGHRKARWSLLGVVLAGFAALLARGLASSTEPPLDLSEFKTVETAQKTTLKATVESTVVLSGYLGVEVEGNAAAQLWIADIAGNSPAQMAGLRRGDLLRTVDQKSVTTPEEFHAAVISHETGGLVTLEVERA